jgi:hypothetical protein
MRRWALATLVQLSLLWGFSVQAQVLKSASTLSPGSLMVSVAPVFVFTRATSYDGQFLALAQVAVGLIKDWDLVFDAGWGPSPGMVPYVGARVEAPLAQDQEGQPGVAFGLGAHWGYVSGLPLDDVRAGTANGALSIDTVLILSKGVGNFVAHAALGFDFIIPSPQEGDVAYLEGVISLGGQYLFTPHISLMAEVGLNSAGTSDIGRYVAVAFVFYAL